MNSSPAMDAAFMSSEDVDPTVSDAPEAHGELGALNIENMDGMGANICVKNGPGNTTMGMESPGSEKMAAAYELSDISKSHSHPELDTKDAEVCNIAEAVQDKEDSEISGGLVVALPPSPMSKGDISPPHMISMTSELVDTAAVPAPAASTDIPPAPARSLPSTVAPIASAKSSAPSSFPSCNTPPLPPSPRTPTAPAHPSTPAQYATTAAEQSAVRYRGAASFLHPFATDFTTMHGDRSMSTAIQTPRSAVRIAIASSQLGDAPSSVSLGDESPSGLTVPRKLDLNMQIAAYDDAYPSLPPSRSPAPSHNRLPASPESPEYLPPEPYAGGDQALLWRRGRDTSNRTSLHYNEDMFEYCVVVRDVKTTRETERLAILKEKAEQDALAQALLAQKLQEQAMYKEEILLQTYFDQPLSVVTDVTEPNPDDAHTDLDTTKRSLRPSLAYFDPNNTFQASLHSRRYSTARYAHHRRSVSSFASARNSISQHSISRLSVISLASSHRTLDPDSLSHRSSLSFEHLGEAHSLGLVEEYSPNTPNTSTSTSSSISPTLVHAISRATPKSAERSHSATAVPVTPSDRSKFEATRVRDRSKRNTLGNAKDADVRIVGGPSSLHSNLDASSIYSLKRSLNSSFQEARCASFLEADSDPGGVAPESAVVAVQDALTRAGFYTKRVRSLTRHLWLIKVRAHEDRLQQEAERIGLRLRRKDGGWSAFRRSFAWMYRPAISLEDAEKQGCLPTLFHSSDRQLLISHILQSSQTLGGAGIGAESALGVYVAGTYPLHMHTRLSDLRSDWLAIWRKERFDGDRDRIGHRRLASSHWLEKVPFLRNGILALAELPKVLSPDNNDRNGSNNHTNIGVSSPHGFRPQTKQANDALPTGVALKTIETAPESQESQQKAFEIEREKRYSTTQDVDATMHAIESEKETKQGCAQLVWNQCKAFLRGCGRFFRHVASHPVNNIASYFGETIAFQFAFQTFFTKALVIPAIVGILLSYYQFRVSELDNAYSPLFSVFVAVWSLVFLELWKRKSAEHAFEWGTDEYEEGERVRPAFRGTWKIDADTGEVVCVYPKWKRILKYCVTIPLLATWMIGILAAMLFIFNVRDELLQQYTSQLNQFHASGQFENVEGLILIDVFAAIRTVWGRGYKFFLFPNTANVHWLGEGSEAPAEEEPQPPAFNFQLQLQDIPGLFSNSGPWKYWLILLLPPLVFSICLPIVDSLFHYVADICNEWENHSTESKHRNAKVTKVFLYRFSVSFLSIFWYAFSPDYSHLQLAIQIGTMLCVMQLWRIVLEFVEPTFLRWYRQYRFERKARQLEELGMASDFSIQKLLEEASCQAWKEWRYNEHQSFEGYSNLLIQFGHVNLFSWVFPLAPACVIVCNLIRMRVDAYNLCYNTKRVVAHKASSIGVWYNVLIVMTFASVLANIAHLVVTSKLWSQLFPGMSLTQKLLLVFAIEHGIFALKFLLPLLISPTSSALKRLQARDRFVYNKLVEVGPAMPDAGLYAVVEQVPAPLVKKQRKVSVREDPL